MIMNWERKGAVAIEEFACDSCDGVDGGCQDDPDPRMDRQGHSTTIKMDGLCMSRVLRVQNCNIRAVVYNGGDMQLTDYVPRHGSICINNRHISEGQLSTQVDHSLCPKIQWNKTWNALEWVGYAAVTRCGESKKHSSCDHLKGMYSEDNELLIIR
ncbi:hypothetical protein Tco_0521875 [Tanacetum coccineum]